jgi:cellobiose phosphorylase
MKPSTGDVTLQHTETIQVKQELDSRAALALDALRGGNGIDSVLNPEQIAGLRRRYSTFEDEIDGDGYLSGSSVKVHKIATPRPYLHLMSSNHDNEYGTWGSFWDVSGAGFCCLDSVLAGAVTSHKDPSYVPTAPRHGDIRQFFLREETGQGVDIWHAFPQRGVDEASYGSFTCRQGLGTIAIDTGRGGIDASLLAFVPVEGPLEIWRLKLVNNSGRARKLDMFCRVTWGLESYPGYYFDPRVVGEGRVYRDLNALVAINNDQNNKHPRTGFLMAGRPFADFDLAAEDFTGGGFYGSFPQAVVQGRCTGSVGIQPYLGLISAARWPLELAPGASWEIDFVLGVTDPDFDSGHRHLATLKAGLLDNRGFERELLSLEKGWQAMVDAHKCATPDPELDRFFNIWSKYQAKNTSRFTRALDKVGYRDLIQDLMSINSFDPGYTRTMLPVALRYQYPDGRAVRQFAKFAGAGHDERMYMDSTSWIPDTLIGYLRETGDMALLDQREGYLDPETGQVVTTNAATVYEHTLRGVVTLYEHRGLYGLCTIGHGDWNDSLDGVGKHGPGVSVWLSMALVYAAGLMKELTVYRGDEANTRLMDEIIATLTAAINEHAWEGSHYVYAFMPDGTPVGADSCEEGKIHLNVNTWSLFNGVAAAAGRTEQVLKAVERLRTSLGYLLVTPGYSKRSKSVGRIADMPAGQFENASIYTHGQSFMVYALATMGRGEDAWAALKTILPENTLPDIATGPPHQVSNYTVGIEHKHFGRNLYSNFSGALSWLRKSLDDMLGLRPGFEHLTVDPCIPGQWKEYKVLKNWRGCRVEMKVSNPGGVSTGVSSASMNGRALAVENGKVTIPAAELPADGRVLLEVVMG